MPRRLVALSPLAEGADRLVAELILDATEHGALHVILPMELADYRTDFATAESQAGFQSLFDRADIITFPDQLPLPEDHTRTATPSDRAGAARQQTREADYEQCGRYVVDHCDVLLVLWDGQPSRGRGGTAEIVAYARQLGRSLVWIPIEAPHDAQYERIEIGV